MAMNTTHNTQQTVKTFKHYQRLKQHCRTKLFEGSASVEILKDIVAPRSKAAQD